VKEAKGDKLEEKDAKLAAETIEDGVEFVEDRREHPKKLDIQTLAVQGQQIRWRVSWSEAGQEASLSLCRQGRERLQRTTGEASARADPPPGPR
jgi:hypothetical protein